MAEAQSRNTMRSVDCFLQSLVSIVNDESASIPVTLSVGGLLISGDMIGGKAYFDSRGKDGRVVEIPTRYLHVWARRQGRWRLVAGGSTRIEQCIEQTKP